MKGSTKFFDYSGVEIHKSPQPINLNVGDNVHIESTPEGKPVLTLYQVHTKVIKIGVYGRVEYEYLVNRLSDPQQQEFFIH